MLNEEDAPTPSVFYQHPCVGTADGRIGQLPRLGYRWWVGKLSENWLINLINFLGYFLVWALKKMTFYNLSKLDEFNSDFWLKPWFTLMQNGQVGRYLTVVRFLTANLREFSLNSKRLRASSLDLRQLAEFFVGQKHFEHVSLSFYSISCWPLYNWRKFAVNFEPYFKLHV